MIQDKSTALCYLDGSHFSFAAPGPCRHNSLMVDTIELFGPRYTPNARILWLHDPANGITIHEQEHLFQLGIHPTEKLALPDILLYQKKNHALFCIEILTSHGTISQERKLLLDELMKDCHMRRVHITACYDIEDYKQCVNQIAWGTYVWLAHKPEHTIFHW